jgi:hypothetical protein
MGRMGREEQPRCRCSRRHPPIRHETESKPNSCRSDPVFPDRRTRRTKKIRNRRGRGRDGGVGAQETLEAVQGLLPRLGPAVEGGSGGEDAAGDGKEVLLARATTSASGAPAAKTPQEPAVRRGRGGIVEAKQGGRRCGGRVAWIRWVDPTRDLSWSEGRSGRDCAREGRGGGGGDAVGTRYTRCIQVHFCLVTCARVYVYGPVWILQQVRVRASF